MSENTTNPTRELYDDLTQRVTSAAADLLRDHTYDLSAAEDDHDAIHEYADNIPSCYSMTRIMEYLAIMTHDSRAADDAECDAADLNGGEGGSIADQCAIVVYVWASAGIAGEIGAEFSRIAPLICEQVRSETWSDVRTAAALIACGADRDETLELLTDYLAGCATFGGSGEPLPRDINALSDERLMDHESTIIAALADSDGEDHDSLEAYWISEVEAQLEQWESNGDIPAIERQDDGSYLATYGNGMTQRVTLYGDVGSRETYAHVDGQSGAHDRECSRDGWDGASLLGVSTIAEIEDDEDRRVAWVRMTLNFERLTT